jgi:hypothetical protein
VSRIPGGIGTHRCAECWTWLTYWERGAGRFCTPCQEAWCAAQKRKQVVLDAMELLDGGKNGAVGGDALPVRSPGSGERDPEARRDEGVSGVQAGAEPALGA